MIGKCIYPKKKKYVSTLSFSFVGTLIANLQKNSNNFLTEIITNSQLSSIRTLKSNDAVSSDIHHDLLV